MSTSGRSQLDAGLEEVAGLSPEYGAALSDHTPMVLEALDRMGQGAAIAAYLKRTLPKLRPLGAEREPALAAYAELVAEAESALQAPAGAHAALSAWLPRFGPGLVGAAFHGVIRVAHALHALERADSLARRGELARALAYATVRAEQLPPAPASPSIGSVDLHVLLVELAPSDDALSPRSGLISSALAFRSARHPTLASAASRLALSPDPHAALRALRSAALALFLRGEILPTNTFTMLHAITGMDAAVTLGDALSPAEAALVARSAAHALLAVRAAFVGRYPIEEAEPVDASLAELVRRAVESLDDHAIKLAAALLRATDDAEDTRARALARWLRRITPPPPA